jgi:hypothetical protein
VGRPTVLVLSWLALVILLLVMVVLLLLLSHALLVDLLLCQVRAGQTRREGAASRRRQGATFTEFARVIRS